MKAPGPGRRKIRPTVLQKGGTGGFPSRLPQKRWDEKTFRPTYPGGTDCWLVPCRHGPGMPPWAPGAMGPGGGHGLLAGHDTTQAATRTGSPAAPSARGGSQVAADSPGARVPAHLLRLRLVPRRVIAGRHSGPLNGRLATIPPRRSALIGPEKPSCQWKGTLTWFNSE